MAEWLAQKLERQNPESRHTAGGRFGVSLGTVAACQPKCARRESNPHNLSVTRSLVLRVCQFHHSRKVPASMVAVGSLSPGGGGYCTRGAIVNRKIEPIEHEPGTENRDGGYSAAGAVVPVVGAVSSTGSNVPDSTDAGVEERYARSIESTMKPAAEAKVTFWMNGVWPPAPKT